jgi:hypothetical protein
MNRFIATILIAVSLASTWCSVAEARWRSGDHTYGFATSHCKRSSCFAKHPGGSYVHPLTYRRRH